MKQIFAGILMLLILVTPGSFAQAAGSAVMELDADTYEVTRGDYVDITVRLNPNGESIDTARAVVTYDPSVLGAQSVRLSGAFDRSAPGNYRDNGAGKLSWGAFTLDGAVTNPTDLITITFLAVGDGNGAIAISPDSRAISNGVERINVSQLDSAIAVSSAPIEADPGASVLVVQSASHENEGNWYSNTDVDLSWTALEGETPIESFRYSFSLDADADLQEAIDSDTSELSLSVEEDGLYYFRLQATHEDGAQSMIAQRSVRIDTTDPNPIELIAQDDKILEGESAWFTFATTDETSGVQEYQIAIDGSEFQPQVSPLEMEDLPAGTYLFRVAAIDRAGNIAYGVRSVRVYPEGTDLSRPELYEEAGEVQQIQNAFTQVTETVTTRHGLLISLVLGVLILSGIIYATRKRKS